MCTFITFISVFFGLVLFVLLAHCLYFVLAPPAGRSLSLICRGNSEQRRGAAAPPAGEAVVAQGTTITFIVSRGRKKSSI